MIEKTILSGLIYNEEYARRVAPFIKPEYFDEPTYNLIFTDTISYMNKFNGLPTKEALRISIDDNEKLNEDQYKNAIKLVDSLEYDPKTDLDWLVERTEKFCQDRAIYNAVRQSIVILDGKDKNNDRGAIPELLSKALGVSFDNHIGHDYLENSDERFEFYHTKEVKIEFDIDLLNKITKGGLSRKSLSVILAPTGVGKTLAMTHMASANLSSGLNVLYITMEMAEERIAERIDANLLDLTVDELKTLDKETFDTRIARVKRKTGGKLVIKEYPTATAGAGHFRHLLNELRLKKNFVPDIIYIDYMNICASSRLKYGANVNSYTLIKSIAEELRGLAVEFNVPVVTATQTTRSGFGNSDLNLDDTSESWAVPATSDFMIALISTEELEELGQIMIKQLKNRWGDIGTWKRFVVGVDRPKMRLYNVENSAQTLSNEDIPAMDKTEFGERMENDSGKGFFKKKKPNFGGFN